MSEYRFIAERITNVISSRGGRVVYVDIEMTTPQAKVALLTLAKDCQFNELAEWMAELGYTVTANEVEA